MKSEHTAFRIHGMDCAEEVAVLKNELGPLVGGEQNLSFDLLRGKLTLAGSVELSSDAIAEAVARTGMKAELWKDDTEGGGEGSPTRPSRRTLLAALSAISCLAGFVLHAWIAGGVALALGSEGLGRSHEVPWAARLLYLLSIVAGAWSVAPKAWYALRRLRPDMNLLMTVAVAGALAIGEWFEAATVSFLFALSLALESWSVSRARRAVQALMELTPQTARVVGPDGQELDAPTETVEIGATFAVRPGERIPLDGVVTGGASEVNQAPITGESVPVPKQPEDAVLAGTINGNGALMVRSTKRSSDTTLAHVTRLVAEAHAQRAPSEQWVDRFARVYTPAIMGLALATALIPPLFLNGAWSEWFYRSLVLLVIGCPCALVISTPVSIVAALAASAKNGVLVKGGSYMEAPARLKAIAFDKTGTLTEGRLEVAEIVPLALLASEALGIAAGMESNSDHPAARAIVAIAKERSAEVRPVEGFEMIPGKGATARLGGKQYWLGSHRYLEERGQETDEIHEKIEAWSGAGRSVVILGDDSRVCALFVLTDTLRAEAKASIGALRSLGISHIAMLTGDNRATADRIGRETGTDEVLAELLPEEKVTAVESLVAKYGQVAMVGDGVNDAPAMGRATLGIAMGAAGSDTAIEAADVALMSDDISKVPWLVRHSRRTLRIIFQNISVSLLVKAVFVVLTFAGYSSLWAAIAADMGASLLVIANGLRLLRPSA